MSRSSYARYRQYRENKQEFELNQIVIPVMVILIIMLLRYIWVLIFPLIGYEIYCCFKKENKVKKATPNMEKTSADTNKKKQEVYIMNTTDVGYVNKNNQKNMGKTHIPGNDHLQWFYQMECGDCGRIYNANGSDIWLRKCPFCQGGKK